MDLLEELVADDLLTGELGDVEWKLKFRRRLGVEDHFSLFLAAVLDGGAHFGVFWICGEDAFEFVDEAIVLVEFLRDLNLLLGSLGIVLQESIIPNRYLIPFPNDFVLQPFRYLGMHVALQNAGDSYDRFEFLNVLLDVLHVELVDHPEDLVQHLRGQLQKEVLVQYFKLL